MKIYFIYKLNISIHNIYIDRIQSVNNKIINTMSRRLIDYNFTEVKENNIMNYSLILSLKLSQLQSDFRYVDSSAF